jgi:hypothetical protein
VIPPRNIKPWRNARWRTLIVASLSITLSDAQQLQTLVRSQEQSRLDGRVQPGRAAWWNARDESRQDAGPDLRLAMSTAYDDNIFLSSEQPEQDTVLLIAPRIAYNAGDKNGEDGVFASAAYQPALVFYAENSGANRADHSVDLAAEWRGKTIVLAYAGSFRRLGDTTADAGTPADRNEYDNVIRLAWQPREKIGIETAVAVAGVRYDQSGFFDSRTHAVEGAVNYIHSPKTRLALVFRVGREEIDQSGDQDAHQILARFAWQPREKISINLTGGIEHRRTDLESGTKPVLEGRVGWQPREGTDLYLAGFLREEASGYFSGQNYRIGNVTAGISQSLGKGWTARLESGFERSSYFRVSGSGAADRVDRTLFLQPSIEFAPRENLRLGIFYRFADNDSNEQGFGYGNQQTGVNLEYDF